MSAHAKLWFALTMLAGSCLGNTIALIALGWQR